VGWTSGTRSRTRGRQSTCKGLARRGPENTRKHSMCPFFGRYCISNLHRCYRWSVTTRGTQIRNQSQPKLPPLITIQSFQSLIVIGSRCYRARRDRDGRPSYTDILRTCLQMSRRIQTSWNGGRCVISPDMLGITYF
jgi:hypothetical protein